MGHRDAVWVSNAGTLLYRGGLRSIPGSVCSQGIVVLPASHHFELLLRLSSMTSVVPEGTPWLGACRNCGGLFQDASASATP